MKKGDLVVCFDNIVEDNDILLDIVIGKKYKITDIGKGYEGFTIIKVLPYEGFSVKLFCNNIERRKMV